MNLPRLSGVYIGLQIVYLIFSWIIALGNHAGFSLQRSEGKILILQTFVIGMNSSLLHV